MSIDWRNEREVAAFNAEIREINILLAKIWAVAEYQKRRPRLRLVP
jgi:hypothetical protein